MTTEGFVYRLGLIRKANPDMVLCAFLHPDGLEVVWPMSPDLFTAGDEALVGKTLMELHNDSAADARAEQARRLAEL